MGGNVVEAALDTLYCYAFHHKKKSRLCVKRDLVILNIQFFNLSN